MEHLRIIDELCFAFRACYADGREFWVGMHHCFLAFHSDSCRHNVLELFISKKLD